MQIHILRMRKLATSPQVSPNLEDAVLWQEAGEDV